MSEILTKNGEYQVVPSANEENSYCSDSETNLDDSRSPSDPFSYFASSSASPSPPLPPVSTSLHLFRLSSLRLHDNPALCASFNHPCTQFKGIFIIDEWFMNENKFGANRWRFLIECLHDIKLQLKSMNLQLYVARGLTTAVLSKLCKEWDVVHLTYQVSCEPNSAIEEKAIDEVCSLLGVQVEKFRTHSLYDLSDFNGHRPILNFKDFGAILPKLGPPNRPILSPVPSYGYFEDDMPDPSTFDFRIPTMTEIGFSSEQMATSPWFGGEMEALKRLPEYCETRMKNFNDPVDMLLDKTSLSPYIRFGCLSVRKFWYYIHDLSQKDKQADALRKEVVIKLLQREFYFLVASQVPNFDQDQNIICLPFPWDSDMESLNKWKLGMTGYPWIDAAICQLYQEGWIHHQLRECIASFLTRGDLWVSWVHGKDLFELLLLDFEPSVSCGCWMKSSGCSFFTNSLEHYCPITFGQKIDPSGKYIRKYLPKLADFPSEYIYTPWMAPISVQRQHNCIIGFHYPYPMVDHVTAGSICIEKLKHSVKNILEQSAT